MGRVRGEPALPDERGLQALEHLVERVCQAGHLFVGVGHVQTGGEIGRRYRPGRAGDGVYGSESPSGQEIGSKTSGDDHQRRPGQQGQHDLPQRVGVFGLVLHDLDEPHYGCVLGHRPGVYAVLPVSPVGPIREAGAARPRIGNGLGHGSRVPGRSEACQNVTFCIQIAYGRPLGAKRFQIGVGRRKALTDVQCLAGHGHRGGRQRRVYPQRVVQRVVEALRNGDVDEHGQDQRRQEHEAGTPQGETVPQRWHPPARETRPQGRDLRPRTETPAGSLCRAPSG